jgi:hypothetical protein
VAYTVQTTVDALHNIPIDLFKSTQTVSKALRCYLLLACYFKLFLWFFPTANSIYNKKYRFKSLIFLNLTSN